MRYAFALVVASLLAGCATLINGTSQTMNFYSTPSGARVYLDGTQIGETPLSYDVSRRNHHEVEFQLEGYQNTQETLAKQTSKMVLVNALNLFIGVPIDWALGGMYELRPNELDVDLEKTAPKAEEKKAEEPKADEKKADDKK